MREPLTVLVIDDDIALRASIAAYLEDSGYTVLEAENGRVGVEQCRREHPALVLCDLRMPEMDGLEVLAVISKELPETPVIVVSGLGGMGDAIESLKLGAWDYVTKPIQDMAVLEHAISRALERANLLRENREYREHLEQVNQQLQRSLQRLEQDETAGRQIQFQLLPEDAVSYDSYRFSRRLLTATYLSGDFVDYFRIDCNHLGFYVADVSGHGVSSAFVTVLLKSYMNRYLEIYHQDGEPAILEPTEILQRLNHSIFRSQLGKYVTMFYGIIDTASGTLYYANAGQFPHPILYDGTEAHYIHCKGRPVGLFSEVQFKAATLSLPERFILTSFSDGILEVLPQEGLDEKQDYLLSLIDDERLEVDDLLHKLALESISTLPDDITLLMIKSGVSYG